MENSGARTLDPWPVPVSRLGQSRSQVPGSCIQDTPGAEIGCSHCRFDSQASLRHGFLTFGGRRSANMNVSMGGSICRERMPGLDRIWFGGLVQCRLRALVHFGCHLACIE